MKEEIIMMMESFRGCIPNDLFKYISIKEFNDLVVSGRIKSLNKAGIYVAKEAINEKFKDVLCGRPRS